MAGYSARQQTYTTGDTITSADTNDEFTVILASFDSASGHAHDGTAGEGPLLLATGALNVGSITSGFGAIDNGTSNITTGGILKIDVDGTAINSAGSLTLGAAGNDAGIYWDGTNLILDTTTKIDVSVSGTSVGTWDVGGIDIVTGDTFAINGTDVLTSTTLGTGVVNSSLTTVGTIATGVWQGTAINATYLSGQSGTNTGDEVAANLTTAGVIEIATIAETNTGTDATRAVSPDGLDGWTGSAQVATVGALNGGSITSGFGNINVGSSTITTTGSVSTGAIDATTADIKTGGEFIIDVDGSAIGAAGSITLGAGGSDASIYWNGTNLELDTSVGIDFSVSGTAKMTMTSGSFDFIDNTIKKPKLLDYCVTEQSVSSSSNATAVDLESGNSVKSTSSENTTWTFSNAGPTGHLSGFTLILTGGASHTHTWHSGILWPGGIAPTLGALDTLEFWTNNAGSTWYGAQVGAGFAA